jgi:hypothetical protein
MMISAPVREHYHRHPYGSCRVNTDHDADWVFVNIPKNASSWMIRAFGRGREDNFLNTHITQRRRYLAVLRDPVDRWISGFAQAQVGTAPWHSAHYRQLGWPRVFSQIVFDNHTEPQVSFLHGLDTQDVTWFRFGPDLAQDILDWSQYHIPLDLQPREFGQDNDYNISDYAQAPWFDHPTDAAQSQWGLTARDIQQQARDVMQQQPEYVAALRDFYHRDIDLINSVVFYRKELQ